MINDNSTEQNIDFEGFEANQGNPSEDKAPQSDTNADDNSSDIADEKDDNSSEMSEASSPAATPDTDWKDKYMRLSAEFDNYRKRTLKEKMDLINTGGEDVIKALLPVLDDLDRALAAMKSSDDVEAARSGTELISNKLKETLRNKGLKEIECIGQELDTDLHEAIAKVPCADEKIKGKIMDVAQKGYSLKDKVVRHAKVVIGE